MIPIGDEDAGNSVKPYVNWTIIGLCVVVFLYEITMPPAGLDAFFLQWGAIPAEISRFHNLYGLITSMFLHGGWTHLLGNMVFLFVFGDNIEDAMGHVSYLLFYLLTGIVAGLTQIVLSPSSTIPLIGASGAIAGVLGAYIVLHPHANVRVFVWILIFVRLVNVPAWILLGLWFAMQVFSGLATPADAEAGVAFWAHVGGFIAGILLILVMRRRGVALLQPAHTEAFRTAPLQALGEGRRFGGGSVPPSGRNRWPPRRPDPGPWG